MKKLIAAIVITLCSSSAFAGPMVEVFTCELNDGKSMSDVNAMMTTFNTMLKKAGLEDSYTAHVGFQQVPVKKNSVNWIGIAPSGEAYGKANDWFNGSEDGAAFGALYNSIYSCDHSFLTFVTASSE